MPKSYIFLPCIKFFLIWELYLIWMRMEKQSLEARIKIQVMIINIK